MLFPGDVLHAVESLPGEAPEEWEEADPATFRISVAFNIDHGGDAA